MDKDKLLQEAVEAGQSGDLKRARELLLKLLQQDNKEPLYWLLMSTAVESRDERIYSLYNVLKLDPENSAAIHDLQLLDAPLPDEMKSAPAFDPEEHDEWQTSEIAAPKLDEDDVPEEEPWPISGILGTLGIGLVLIALGFYAASNGYLDSILDLEDSPASTASSAVDQHIPTATGSFITASRDPEDLLPATYTPTPLYVNTDYPDSLAFQAGMQAFADEDWQVAIDHLRTHLESQPDSPTAAYYIGLAHMQTENYADALQAFEQSVEINQQFAPGYLGLGQAGMALQAEDANIIAGLNTAVLLDDNYAEAYLTRADYYIRRGDYERGLEDLSRAEDLASESPLVHYYKGRAYLGKGDYTQALASSQVAYELDLTLLPNYLVLAESHIEQGESQEALNRLQTYLTFEGEDGRGWELLGLAYQLEGEQELALEAFEQALSKDPKLPFAAYYRGLQLKEEGNNPTALDLFRSAVNGEPDWFEARIAVVEALLDSDDAGSAFFEVNSSSNFIETNEQRAAFHYWRATILETLGQEGTALADWQSLLELPESSMPAEWRQIAQDRVQS